MRLRTKLTKQPSSITRNQETDQDKAPWTAKCTYTQTILLCFVCVQHCTGDPVPCTHLTSLCLSFPRRICSTSIPCNAVQLCLRATR